MKTLDYDRLAAQYRAHRQVHPGVLRALCSQVRQEHTVLEVGCGTGNYVIALAALTGCQGWGIDPSVEMLARAQQRLDDSSLSTVFLRRGWAEHLDLPDDQFDLVFSVDMIHHVQDRAAYLQHTYRTLKRGGRVCTATDSEWIIRHRETPISPNGICV
jgi:ubiquinone/menaquinone biosynthesis C-methylase UbiE